MVRRILVGALGGAACALFAAHSLAECRMDNDCTGDLVCENAQCVAPSSVPTPAPAAAPTPPAPVARVRPARVLTPAPGLAPTPTQAEQPPADAPRRPARGKRHSTGMFVTGIVFTSMAPIGLLVASVGALCSIGNGYSEDDSSRGRSSDCGDLVIGGFVATAIFAGIGVPLIVIGAQRDPVATGRVTPWLTPHSAGLGLHFDL